jgi:hypothetical protein
VSDLVSSGNLLGGAPFLKQHLLPKADVERAMRLSPRDPDVGSWHVDIGDAEISLGHFDAAIEPEATGAVMEVTKWLKPSV